MEKHVSRMWLLLLCFVCEVDMKGKCSVDRTIQDNLYRPGEAIIGGVLSLTELLPVWLGFTKPPDRGHYPALVKLRKYQHALSLMFAIDEINRNPRLLPNVTLGFHIYDNFFNARTTHEIILDLLFTQKKIVANYRCDRKKSVLAVIGEFPAESMIETASIFSIYKIPQFTYSTHKSFLSGKAGSPSLHRILPREATHHMGIIHLLLYFQWRWVGLIVSDDDSGESFLQHFTPLLTQHSFCVAFLLKDTLVNYESDNRYLDNLPKLVRSFLSSKANVIVLKEDSTLINSLANQLNVFESITNIYIGKVWIMPPQWYFSTSSSVTLIGAQLFQGALSFSISAQAVPGFWDFLHTFQLGESQMRFLCLFWHYAFRCHLSDTNDKQSGECTGNEKLESLPRVWFEMDMTGQSYAIYNAVYAVAHVLHSVYLSRQGTVLNRGKPKHLNVQPWQLQRSLKNIHFNNGAVHEVLFENGELSVGYDIVNWLSFPNQTFLKVQVGEISSSHEFFIRESTIVWNSRLKQMPPHSKCVESCHFGHSQIIQEGKPACCYDCAPCLQNMISNMTDADHCVKCQQDQYPNKNHDQCNPKTVTFLSYQEPMGMILLSLALSFAMTTCWVMQIFWMNWDTPIVKANNRGLACTLLVSILLCYLSSLLFIGKPGQEPCLVRQMAFGILFSVSISCVLARTVVVVLAFKATKPGSRWRRFLGKGVANSVVLSCSLIQVGICLAWVSFSPPFPRMDMHSQAEQIIVECDEGSITFFCSVLAYMGFLATISFTVAFLARKLPDTFNEAKFITFSMLVFCTVWISFLPAYLSAKGKQIVVVEMFAILASNTGLLACIFSPKCYIIVLRADLNSRKSIIEKRS